MTPGVHHFRVMMTLADIEVEKENIIRIARAFVESPCYGDRDTYMARAAELAECLNKDYLFFVLTPPSASPRSAPPPTPHTSSPTPSPSQNTPARPHHPSDFDFMMDIVYGFLGFNLVQLQFIFDNVSAVVHHTNNYF